MEKISAELLETLKGANKLAKGASDLINKPELQDAVNDLKESLHAFKDTLNTLNRHVEPVAVNLEKAIGEGQKTLNRARATMGLIDEVLKSDSPLQFKFIELTEDLAEMARAIRTLVDMLERNPDALIFGKNSSGEK